MIQRVFHIDDRLNFFLSHLCNPDSPDQQIRPVLCFPHLRQLRGLICGDEAVKELVDVPVHDVIKLIQGELDAMVGHAALGKIVGADLFGAVAA